MAYTGLAELDRKRTDLFIVDELTAMRAGVLPGEEVIRILASRLSEAVRRSRFLRSERGITVAYAGYQGNRMLWGLLSNQEDDDGVRFPEPVDQFTGRTKFRNAKVMRLPTLLVCGAETTAAPILKLAIRGIRDRLVNTSLDERARLLVDVVRRAAANRGTGRSGK